MADMLVNLLQLPPLDPLIDGMRQAGVVVRRAAPHEITRVRRFVEEHFSTVWADEISVGYANKPVSVFLAIREGEVIGFSAYECTRRGFFGPTGVAGHARGKGVGLALLVASLHGLAQMGYAYGIIGGVGPAEFYTRAVGATLIPDSTPGIYADPLSDAGPPSSAKPSR
ncbi:GNAT family acetyltransferase [Sorangium cellulosum]|uniref:GNAT family acetyltransferase n=1 Tax=Sorangium cellulosum TaxID=56 RepID=A0A2L0EVX3_SORCE|nr:GNAT family N-acetyltransferase [Sorangium cellulosum]AUX43419.1 GNAT family acetyltransferase [Sorangium cellulosum]